MTIQPGASLYTQGFGSRPENVEIPHIDVRAPATTDVNYPIGKVWVNQTDNSAYTLTSITASAGVLSATWVTTGGGSGAVATLTGDSGGPISPSGGNINILGGSLDSFVGSGHTLTLTPKAGAYPVTPFVVGPSGQAGYQTIQSAITAAHAAGGGVVLVQPGTYTENLTLFDACHVMGLDFADAGGGVTIIGVHTPPASGGFVFNNVALQSATHIFSSAVAGTAHLVIANAAITVTNGYTFNLLNWTGKLEVFDVNDRGSTNDGFVNNTGGATVAFFDSAVGAGNGNTMTLSGAASLFTCAIGSPINCVTGSNFFIELCVPLNTVTFSNNSTGEVVLCEIDAQVTMSSSAAILLTNSIINTASSPAIAGSGAGTLTLGDITFGNNSTIAGTLTTAWIPTKTGALTATGAISGSTTITAGTGITSTTGNIVATAGAVNAGTSMTATLGNITATNGNVVLNTAGNKLVIATGSNASVGTSAAMSGTPGAITVSTTASSATAKIFYARNATGGTPGQVSITAQDGTGFTLTSTANETSTFNWWIINA